MTRQFLVGASILSGSAWLDDHAVILDGQYIEAIIPRSSLPSNSSQTVLKGGKLVPGFIDTQVNGGGGVLFNNDLTIAGISNIARAHRRFGTTGFLPTLISDDLSAIQTAIDTVDAAIAAKVPGVLGIHIEGPFLNAGKAGIHDKNRFRQLSAEAVDLLASLRHGKTLVTLAPELCDASLLKALVARGVIVSIGHSLATYEQARQSFADGITGVTHLFNAMSQLESRAPGVVGAALLNPDCFSGLIVDGNHVHPATMKLAYEVRGPTRLMLVTDAMSTVGSDAHEFFFSGQLIRAVGGACIAEDGTLAGSNLDMAMAVRNTMSMIDVPLELAAQMASATPANYLGLGGERGKLKAGYRADIVYLGDKLNVSGTWIGGSYEGDALCSPSSTLLRAIELLPVSWTPN